MTFRIHDSTLEHRINVKMATMSAAEHCYQALTAGICAREEANFETASRLGEANGLLAMAGRIYADIATEAPLEINLHPALERQMKQAGENEIPL